MGYWDDRSASPTNLRLLQPATGWKKHDDQAEAETRIIAHGSTRDIELALTAALNATHLLLLAGAGSSFCARNSGNKKPPAPGMRDLWNAVKEAVGEEALNKVLALIPSAAGINENIEKLLTLCKLYVTLFGEDNAKELNGFIQKAERSILSRVDFIDEKTDLSTHRTLVRKIARRGARKPRTRVFTTNYDLCFEYAAQAQQFVVIDGFSHSRPQVYDRAHFSYDIVRREGGNTATDYIENVFHLYKLHGSLDWRREGPLLLRSRDANGEPALIYPRDTKYQEAFEAPYLDMMGALQAALREPDTAIIISGFGFNDDHISKPIMAAIEANMSLKVVVCDVGFLRDADLEKDELVIAQDAAMRVANFYFSRLKELALLGDSRIILMNGRFEDLAVAIPDLVAQTERERHMQRMQGLLREPVEGRST